MNQVQTADLALREFTDGVWLNEKAKAETQIKQAEVELRRAEQSVVWRKGMVLKGLIATPEKHLGDRWVETATREHEQAEKNLETLISVTKVNRIMSLRGDIERSRFAQQATEAILELELAREPGSAARSTNCECRQPRQEGRSRHALRTQGRLPSFMRARCWHASSLTRHLPGPADQSR